MYGGDGGSRECKYEFMRCTNVDFPAPAIPMVIMVIGFFFAGVDDELAPVDAIASRMIELETSQKLDSPQWLSYFFVTLGVICDNNDRLD